jgi:hypothetical protein
LTRTRSLNASAGRVTRDSLAKRKSGVNFNLTRGEGASRGAPAFTHRIIQSLNLSRLGPLLPIHSRVSRSTSSSSSRSRTSIISFIVHRVTKIETDHFGESNCVWNQSTCMSRVVPSPRTDFNPHCLSSSLPMTLESLQSVLQGFETESESSGWNTVHAKFRAR